MLVLAMNRGCGHNYKDRLIKRSGRFWESGGAGSAFQLGKEVESNQINVPYDWLSMPLWCIGEDKGLQSHRSLVRTLYEKPQLAAKALHRQSPHFTNRSLEL